MYDVAIIGSGPGGYVAAIRARQLGLKTAVIERDKLGGVCLNVGCIPSKSLIHQAEIFSSIPELSDWGVKTDISGFDYKMVYKASRKAADKLSRGIGYLLKKNGIDVVQGEGVIKDKNTVLVNGSDQVRAKNIIIATGSSPRTIPGFEFDEQQVLSSTGLLMMDKLPSSLVILGGGVIGIEFAYIMNAFGVEVTVVEAMPRILPLEEEIVSQTIEKFFKKRGVTFITGAKATGIDSKKNGLTLHYDSSDKKETVEAEKLLVSIGRKPNTDNIGLDAIGVKTEKGFIKTGDYYQTGADGVYAIGDVLESYQFAHLASGEGETAVERIAGKNPRKRIDGRLVPRAIYCKPEVASFGPGEESLKKENIPYEKSEFPYQAIGKAVASGVPEGFVRIYSHKNTGEILGSVILGENATELIHEILLGKSSELLPEDIAGTIHAHPTISEGVMEAAKGLLDGSIHV